MRTLLKLILKYHHSVLFVSLEIVGLVIVLNFNDFHHTLLSRFSQNVSSSIFLNLSEMTRYFRLKEINRQVMRENLMLRNQLAGAPLKPIPELAAPVDSSGLPRYRYTPARVTSNSVNKQRNYIYIDKGKNDGLAVGMGVISSEGVVGMVYALTENYSMVMSVANIDFRASGKLLRSNYFGSLQWDGKNYRTALLKEIPYHVAISKGDTIVTSGFAEAFPEGVPVGTISGFDVKEGNFYTIQVALATDLKKLHYVYVVEDLHKSEFNQLKLSESDD